MTEVVNREVVNSVQLTYFALVREPQKGTGCAGMGAQEGVRVSREKMTFL